MSHSYHSIVSQSNEELHQSTAHNHELAAITPRQYEKGKRKTSATDDKTCLNLLQKKSNTDVDTHFFLSLVENLKSLQTKKKIISKK